MPLPEQSYSLETGAAQGQEEERTTALRGNEKGLGEDDNNLVAENNKQDPKGVA